VAAVGHYVYGAIAVAKRKNPRLLLRVVSFFDQSWQRNPKRVFAIEILKLSRGTLKCFFTT